MGAITGKAANAFSNQAYLKFAATVNDEGEPNVVPLLSAKSIDADHIAFVRFMVWKTARNFESNKKIGFGCTGPWGKAFYAKGEFQEWVTKGPLLEQFENEALYRYNAYMGANMVGLVKVKEVMVWPGSGIIGNALAGALKRFAPKPASNGSGPMPSQVMDKFNRTASVKFLGLVGKDGEPIAVPHQGLSAPEAGSISFAMPGAASNPLNSLEDGQPLAASVLAFEPVAYQVKGKFRKQGNRGALDVEQVFAAAPPLPGKRIYPAEVQVSH